MVRLKGSRVQAVWSACANILACSNFEGGLGYCCHYIISHYTTYTCKGYYWTFATFKEYVMCTVVEDIAYKATTVQVHAFTFTRPISTSS